MPETMTARAPRMPAFDYQPRPYTGPGREEVLAARRQFTSPALFTLYREPLMLVEGRMQYLFDETGRPMVLMTHNTDIADGWEREADLDAYFQRFAWQAYSVGVNVMIWMMTR